MNLDKKMIKTINDALNISKDYFLIEFAKLVCGDNEASVYKTSGYISSFFQYLEYPFVHDGSTRKIWVRDVLEQLKAEDLYRIYLGLISAELHLKIGLEEPDSRAIRKEFKKILKVSLKKDGIPKSFNNIIDIKQKKLHDKGDEYMDALLEQSEKLFKKGEIKEAINNTYDAFERIKNYYYADKKKSVFMIISNLTEKTGIDKSYFEERFRYFNILSNDYNIRHHDKKVKLLKEISYEYIYNDMINFLNLIINIIKDNNEK